MSDDGIRNDGNGDRVHDAPTRVQSSGATSVSCLCEKIMARKY